jgi:anti-sigma-K factor RskA
MNCAQAEELLGAYALDALPPEEAREFRAHIATCREHADKAAGLRNGALALAESVEPVAAPLALRARILDAAAREPQVSAAAGAGTVPASFSDGVRRRDERRAMRTPWFAPNAWTAIAAAVAALAIGLGAWALSSNNADDDAQRFASAAPSISDLKDTSGARIGTVVYFKDEHKAAVVMDDLPDPGAGKTYQLWAIEGGAPVSIGVMDEGASGRQVRVVNIDAEKSEALAITIEPAGGSDQPTSQPIYSVEI